MLLAPQHRRSARIEARMQKRVQKDFNERVANGTMTKEELLNAPKCLRNFDEAEDAILAQHNTSWCGKSQNNESEDDSEDESDDDEFDNESTESMGSNPEGPVGGEFLWGGDEGSVQNTAKVLRSPRLAALFTNGHPLPEDPLLLRLIVSKLPVALVAAIIQQLILELDDVERGVDDANMDEEEEEEKEEDSIASRLLKRRLIESRGW